MDYIRQFDIKLEKDVYYSGETVSGRVIIDSSSSVKVRGIRAVLRGKCHAEWKIMKGGERRTVKDDQYFIDDKVIVWGNDKGDDLSIPILESGVHKFPFKFPLPEIALPCSFESKAGTIRYYIKVTIDIPYASPPQGIKHFTVIGPNIDCGEAKFLTPVVSQDMKVVCCLCCKKGPITLRSTLQRSAYCAGERLLLNSDVDNGGTEAVRLCVRLMQHIEYFIDRGVLGVTKYMAHEIGGFKSDLVPSGEKKSFDELLTSLVVPVTPPTLIGIARLIQIYYVVKICLEFPNNVEDLHMDFPVTVATVPLRQGSTANPTRISYEPAADNVEGGMYTSPEFQVGQVYDGTMGSGEDVILYRPIYVKLCSPGDGGGAATTSKAAPTSNQTPKSLQSSEKSNQQQPPPLTNQPSSSSLRRVDIVMHTPQATAADTPPTAQQPLKQTPALARVASGASLQHSSSQGSSGTPPKRRLPMTPHERLAQQQRQQSVERFNSSSSSTRAAQQQHSLDSLQ